MKECLDERKNGFAEQAIACIKAKCKMNIVRWEPTKKEYPSYMLLGPDKGILAYINFGVWGSKDLMCFRHDHRELLEKLRLAVSDLDRPVFNIYQVIEEN